jgi:hypothetical protein
MMLDKGWNHIPLLFKAAFDSFQKFKPKTDVVLQSLTASAPHKTLLTG